LNLNQKINTATFISFRRILLISAVITLIFAGLIFIYRLDMLGFFYNRGAYNEVPLECTEVYGMTGPEDLVSDLENGIVYLSAYDRRKNEKGNIYLLDLNSTGGYQPVRLTLDKPDDFRPHGISIFKKNPETNILWVINHRSENLHTIERFEHKIGSGFRHIETLYDSLFISPNDLVVTAERQFYFTNDGRSRSKVARSVDTFFNRATGSIGFYDGSKTRLIATDLRFPNGIAADTLNNKLYVTETITGHLLEYELAKNGSHVNVINTIDAGAGLDNITIDTAGNLWVARHPDLISLNSHMSDPKKKSPSMVLTFGKPLSDSNIEIIFRDDGSLISGASSAVVMMGKLIIGSVSDNKVLICSM